MTGRLRVAGTVELGGLARPAEPEALGPARPRRTRACFPALPDARSQWLGFRPSMPDSVPVIGRARGVPAVMLAFGHGHLGLTLAAVTAELVAAEVAGHGRRDRAGAVLAAALFTLTRPHEDPTMAHAHTLGGRVYRFDDLKTLLAKATPERSGDQLAGIAAADRREERMAARLALADLPLAAFLRRAAGPLRSRRGHAADRRHARRRGASRRSRT